MSSLTVLTQVDVTMDLMLRYLCGGSYICIDGYISLSIKDRFTHRLSVKFPKSK